MHAVGPVTDHIKLSNGGESSLLNHYCTTTKNSFGSSWQHFVPRTGHHIGAGYKPNNRGQIFYTSHLDEIDNPKMGEIIKTNYKSITKKDYIGFKIPSGKEVLPLSTLYQPTGFVRETGVHLPNHIQLQSQFINSLLEKSPANISEKHKPLLHQIQSKDPIMLENYGHGPFYMSTEYKTRFKGKQCPEHGSGTVGNNEMTGFTENNKIEEPLEGRPDACMCNCDNNGSTNINCRPIGISIYNTHYRPLSIPTGREPLPNIELRADFSNGYSTGNKAIPDYVKINPDKVYDKAENMSSTRLEWLKKNDPAEYVNANNCQKFPTMMNSAYQGKQIHSNGKNDFRSEIGNREITGYTSNEDAFVQTRDNPERFITHSMTQFYDPILLGNERNGHVNGQVDSIKESGLSREVKLHKLEPQLDALKEQSKFTPYQSRSITVRESVTVAPTKILA